MNYRDLANIKIEDDILIFEYISEQEITLEIAQELLKYRLEMAQGKSYKIISAFPLIKGMTKEARDFLGADEAKVGIKAVAIVNDSDVGRMIANIFMTFNLKRKSDDPQFKVFKSIDAARVWLDSLDV